MEEIVVRFAFQADLDFVTQDHCIPADVVRRKIDDQEVVVAQRNDHLVGYIRLEYLWSLTPYLALIHVRPDHRRQGVGRAMLQYLETFLVRKGHQALYSSSQADEPSPQAWHRAVGFVECGFIAGINPGEIVEIFFRKQL
jgi:ribosomal protein S18 acetylase RimI-like enzyme